MMGGCYNATLPNDKGAKRDGKVGGKKGKNLVAQLFLPCCLPRNRRDALFKDETDFKTFLIMLEQINNRTPFELASYCLMTKHYHLQMRSKQQLISKVMSLINKRYTDYYNTKNRITGHVFEKRYYDEVIVYKQGMLEVSRYIHLNPLEAGIVINRQNYR